MDERAVVGPYVEQIDRLLAAACSLFPNGQLVPVVDVVEDWTQVSAPLRAGGLTTATERAGAGYRDAGARIAALTEAINNAVNAAAADGRQAGAAAASIRDTARSQAAAFTPVTPSPEGLRRLVSTMDERLAAMQLHIGATRERMRAAAEQIRQHAVELAAVRAGER